MILKFWHFVVVVANDSLNVSENLIFSYILKSFRVVHLQLSKYIIVLVVFENKKSEFNLLIPFSGGNVLNFT